MKKQFRCQRTYGFRVFIELYHDGELVETKKLWEDDEYLNFIESLESNGYTYGYKKEEVEEAKERYERMLCNMIEVKSCLNSRY